VILGCTDPTLTDEYHSHSKTKSRCCCCCTARERKCHPLEVYFGKQGIKAELVKVRPGLPVYVYEELS